MGKERNVPWEEILRRRKEGETARALAEEFGVSVESVYKRGQRERLEQRGSLQQAARNLCRSAGSMVAQMEDMDAKELKELTALLRELVTLEERTDRGPETVKVVLAKEANLFVINRICISGSFFDTTFDRVIWHIVCFCFCNDIT